MSDAAGFAELDRMIATMRKLGQAAPEVAIVAAPLVDAASKATASAGTTPSGTAWAPKKNDGTRALANAASAVSAAVVAGTVIQIRIDGNATGDQRVQSIQNTRRQMIPAPGDDIPPGVSNALQSAAVAFFKKAVAS